MCVQKVSAFFPDRFNVQYFIEQAFVVYRAAFCGL
jgi:hypothetical protein